MKIIETTKGIKNVDMKMLLHVKLNGRIGNKERDVMYLRVKIKLEITQRLFNEFMKE